MTSGNWYNEFQPSCVEELAVSPQRFYEVRSSIKKIFETTDQKKYLLEEKLLILSGPPGSGKTTTLNLAINSINQESEQCQLRGLSALPYIYINRFDPYPIGSSHPSAYGSAPIGSSHPSTYGSAITRFKDWICDNVWFATPEALRNKFKAQVLLLKEPFTFNGKEQMFKEQKAKFLREIKNYLKREDIRMPIIWIITETSINVENWNHEERKSVDTVYNTVPNDILKDQKVTHVKFLPVAPLFLKRGLGAFLNRKFPRDDNRRKLLDGNSYNPICHGISQDPQTGNYQAIKRECVMRIMDQVIESGVNDIRQALNFIQNTYTIMEITEKIPSYVSPHKYNRAGKLLNAPRKPLLNTQSSIKLPRETISEIHSIVNKSVNFEKSVNQFECLDLVFEVKGKDCANLKPIRIIDNMQIDYEKFGELAFSNYLEYYSSMAELASASEAFSNYDILHANNYNKRSCSLILMNGLIESRTQNSPKRGFVTHKNNNNSFNFNQSMLKNNNLLWSIKRGEQRLFEKDVIGTQNANFIMVNHSKEDLAMSVLPYLRRMSKFDKLNTLKISDKGKTRLNEFGKLMI